MAKTNPLQGTEFDQLLTEMGAKPLKKGASKKPRVTIIPGEAPLAKSVVNILDTGADKIQRLAFESDPSQHHVYASLYIPKRKLLPDDVLKRISIQDDLVAAITMARGNHVSAHGRPQPDRFSTGFKIEPEPGLMARLDPKERESLQKEIADAELRLLSCGQTAGYPDHQIPTFVQFMYITARNAVIFGRAATERIWVIDPRTGDLKFHSFRPIDAGTIYRCAPLQNQGDSIRREARRLLEQLNNTKIDPERYLQDEYAWVQVINGKPVQAFTADECSVYNFYPATDVELDGYPITPLDTVVAAVMTHMNITTHNRMYFQNGRAARGMIVIQSDEVDDAVIAHIRQQFQASINAVDKAWRMPIFGVGTDDKVEWYPIDNSSRDQEFQYLSDSNARTVLTAFLMSPEELPGLAHLSRGTNSQALSEGNQEYKLTAARDVGLRPLLAHIQNYINQFIFPLLAPKLSGKCSLKFVGLDAETAEKESIRLQQDLAVHMTVDEVLEKVEKKTLGRAWGGQFLLNPQWQAALDKYVPVGGIMEHFFGIEGAAKDPRFQYLRDPFYFQQQQFLMEVQQAQQQAQQMQAQAQQGGPGQPAAGGQGGAQGQPEPTQTGPDQTGPQTQDEQEQAQPEADEQGQELTRSIDQLANLLGKSERLPAGKRKLLAQQKLLIQRALKTLEVESRDAIKEILAVVDHHVKKN